MLAPVLAVLTGLFARCCHLIYHPIIRIEEILNNFDFLLSHITNHGRGLQLFKFFNKCKTTIWHRTVMLWRNLFTFLFVLYVCFLFSLFFSSNIGYSYDLRSKSRGIVLLVSIWLLMTVVLANGYAGTLFSFLTITKLTQPINSLKELANATDIQLLTHV